MRDTLRATCGYNLVGSFIILCATYDFTVDPCAEKTCVSVSISTKDHNRSSLSRFVNHRYLFRRVVVDVIFRMPFILTMHKHKKKVCINIIS